MRKGLFVGWFAFLCATAYCQNVKPLVVGNWQYDMASMKFTIDPVLTRQMKYDRDAAKFIPRMVANQVGVIKARLATTTMTFRPNGTFTTVCVQDKTTTHGTWRFDKERVTVTYTSGKNGPFMTVIPKLKKIRVSVFGENLGTLNGFLTKTGG